AIVTTSAQRGPTRRWRAVIRPCLDRITKRSIRESRDGNTCPGFCPCYVSTTQVIGTIDKTGIFVRSPLQDLLAVQPAVLIGLIAHLVGTPQQDDIVRTTDRLLRLGQDILAMSEGPAPAPPDRGGRSCQNAGPRSEDSRQVGSQIAFRAAAIAAAPQH